MFESCINVDRCIQEKLACKDFKISPKNLEGIRPRTNPHRRNTPFDSNASQIQYFGHKNRFLLHHETTFPIKNPTNKKEEPRRISRIWGSIPSGVFVKKRKRLPDWPGIWGKMFTPSLNPKTPWFPKKTQEINKPFF